MRCIFIITLLLTALSSFSQKKTAHVSGKIVDENDNPLSGVSILILGNQQGVKSTDSGTFQISVPADRAFGLVFSHSGYQTKQQNFLLSNQEEESITVLLYREGTTLETVTIKDETARKETGLIRINPKNAVALPSAAGGVEGLIKVLVGSNNELTSQYSVRGGNYDENLIYINDFEIYRPYLIRSGQQEGLSFINPDLVKNIQFFNGGFQAKYGDKISSVLDIQYKTPSSSAGTVYISLLEQGLHLEGVTKNKKGTWMFGARTKTTRNLLSGQENKGHYQPSASDLQTLITWKLSDKNSLEFLGILSGSEFYFEPESARKSSTVITRFFAANLGLDIYFEGSEKDRYASNLLGLAFVQKLNPRLTLKWMASRYNNQEKEHFDIAGAYLFGDRSFDKAEADFGKIVNPLGAGMFHNYARNDLQMNMFALSHKGTYKQKNHYLQWGASFDHTAITDHLNEWEYIDSAGYSLPVDFSNLRLNQSVFSTTNLNVQKYSGYVQDNIRMMSSRHDITLQAGMRFLYQSLNGEFLLNPRAQASLKPDWKRDIVFKLSAGMYSQPPFYRELRKLNGTLNLNVKSQKSMQYVTGFDYNLISARKPMRISTEIYYKSLWDVVPYELENVRIRYHGENNAKAYAAGIETRIFTELVKDAESWFSIGISQTKEKIAGDHYYLYKNAAGEIIHSKTEDQVITDSVYQETGYVRRPSDRLLTMGLFLQDYLSTNKNFKVHLNLLYGSNMSYNIPGSSRYRNALKIDPYIRADIGFSALLLSQKAQRRSHSPFRSFENIWASLEMFNLIDRANVISYQMIKDYDNNIFSIPNRLTARMIQFKLLARW